MVSKMCAGPLSYVQERPPQHTHISQFQQYMKMLNKTIMSLCGLEREKNQRVMHDVNEVLGKSTKQEKVHVHPVPKLQWRPWHPTHLLLSRFVFLRAVVPMFSIVLKMFNDGNWTGLFRAMGIFGGKISSAQTNYSSLWFWKHYSKSRAA